MWVDVDTALASVPVNSLPLIDDTDFKTIEAAVVYNQAGLALFWNFTTTAGVTTVTAVTPTTAGVYDWTDFTTSGMYGIEIPASGGASANNDTEGFGFFTGVATGILPWRGPTIGFRAAALNNALVDGGDELDVNVLQISGDAGAADNLELMYDGTGYTDDTAPASRGQVGSLATGSAAISTQSESYVLTTGTQSSGTISDTETNDDVEHQHTDTAGVMELYYQFDVNGNGVATEVDVLGRINGGNDDLDGVYAYDWVGAGWDRIGDFEGKVSAVNDNYNFSLLTRNTGTGANLGKVRIRFYAASGLTTATLSVDQIYVSYAVVAQSVGYDGGQVWIDTAEGVAGTESYVNGVADNPVDTLASAITIASNLNLHRLYASRDSTLAPSADFNDYTVSGTGYAFTLGGHDYAGTHIYHASPLTGTATSAVNADHFDILDSIIGDITVDDAHFTSCGFTGTLTMSGVGSGTPGEMKFINCFSLVAGSTTPIFDFGTGTENHNVTFANWQNGLEIRNFNVTTTGGTDLLSISGTGQLIIASTCDGGTINLRGQWKVTDNSGGAVTILQDDVATSIAAIEVDTSTTLDTKIDAIKVPTDKMVFTKTNELDVNTKSINDAEVIGDGNATPWDGV